MKLILDFNSATEDDLGEFVIESPPDDNGNYWELSCWVCGEIIIRLTKCGLGRIVKYAIGHQHRHN